MATLAMACGPRPPPASCPPRSLAATPSPALPAPTPPPLPSPPIAVSCPIAQLTEAPPGILTFRDLKEATTRLRRGTLGDPLDLAALAKRAPAFGIEVRQDHYHESVSSYAYGHAVFVVPRKVIVAHRLVEPSSSIPPPCGTDIESEILAVRIVATSRYPRLGHIRLRRADVDDEPTLPAVVATAAARCPDLGRYRIEDHFIDLDQDHHLIAVFQVYTAPRYEAPRSPAIPIEAITFDATGFEVALGPAHAGCPRQFAWRH
ncbi:MAG: hypothetical protein H0T79_02565 [Deltaproteobacteria bacterium]|nr:hypothetical protein [Deltaproteobacteria bacterium]